LRRGNLIMTKTYRDVAIEQMIATVEDLLDMRNES
jgi:hypothetical protein